VIDSSATPDAAPSEVAALNVASSTRSGARGCNDEEGSTCRTGARRVEAVYLREWLKIRGDCPAACSDRAGTVRRICTRTVHADSSDTAGD